MNKQEIIQEAVKIANEKGLANLSMAGLAKAFHVKPPSLYKHIESLQAIQDELGILCMEKLIRILQAECFGLHGDEALRQFCRLSRSFALASPGLYRAMQLTHVKRSEPYRQKAQTLMMMLEKLISPYKIKKTDTVHTIRFLRCLLHGFIDLEIQQGFGYPDDLNRSFQKAVESFIIILKKQGRKK